EALPTPYLPLRRTLGFDEDCKTSKRPVKRGYLFTGPFSYVVVFCLIVGGNLLSHTLPGAVPSARAGLASGFGMGNRAFPCRYRHRQIIGTNCSDALGCCVRYCIVDAFTPGVSPVCLFLSVRQESFSLRLRYQTKPT